MNILIDHQIFTLQRFGGISRTFIELMRELSHETSDCSIYWFRGLHLDRYDISDFRKRLKRYVGFQRREATKVFDQQLNRFLIACFYRLTGMGKVDIYHPTYYDFSFLEVVRSKKLVVTIHDMILEMFLSSVERFQRTIIDKRKLIERADLIFVNSKSTMSDLIRILNVHPSRIRITYWASRLKNASVVSLPIFCKQKPYFLYVGTRSKYKNFGVLAQAFGANEWLRRNFNLVAFGGSYDYIESELKLFEELRVRENFFYLAGDDNLLKMLYANSAGLVHTSRYEGFGLAVLEAMECACPVICCNNSCMPEIAGECALFFDPDSPEQLGECMRKMAQDSFFCQSMVQKGKERAKLFGWEKTAKETLEGYKSLF